MRIPIEETKNSIIIRVKPQTRFLAETLKWEDMGLGGIILVRGVNVKTGIRDLQSIVISRRDAKLAKKTIFVKRARHYNTLAKYRRQYRLKYHLRKVDRL